MNYFHDYFYYNHNDEKVMEASDNPQFTVTIDTMTVTLVFSAALYCVCCRLAHIKYNVLNDLEPQMTTKKLLILSVLLVSVLRIMTILGVAAMNVANIRAHYSLQPSQHRGGKTQDFYDEAMTVLFDLPNSIVVSTYVLLTLVWAECFLEARFHTENAMYWKRRLLIGFMVFNALLYAVSCCTLCLLRQPVPICDASLLVKRIPKLILSISFTNMHLTPTDTIDPVRLYILFGFQHLGSYDTVRRNYRNQFHGRFAGPHLLRVLELSILGFSLSIARTASLLDTNVYRYDTVRLLSFFLMVVFFPVRSP